MDLDNDKELDYDETELSLGKLLSNVVTGILFLLIIALFILGVASKSPDGFPIGGIRGLTIVSGSMEPTIPTGSLIIIGRVDEKDLKVEDIITYMPVDGSDTLVTHRIIKKSDDNKGFITKGDANKTQDRSVVEYKDILGRVSIILPGVGLAMSFVQTPFGFLAVVFFILLMVVLSEFFKKSKQ